jgi:hypothetical protein
VKKLAITMSIGLAIGVCQQALAQETVEKGKSVAIEIPVDSDTACNIEVTRGGEKTNVRVDPKNKKGVYEFVGRELGDETIRWEGKMKFRGLKTLGPCRGDGAIKVVTVESGETTVAGKQVPKAEEKATQAETVKENGNKVIEELKSQDQKKSTQAQQPFEQKASEYYESDDSLAQPDGDPFSKRESMRQSIESEKNEYKLQKVSARLLTCEKAMLGVNEVAEINGELFLRAGVGFFDEFDRFAAVTTEKVLKGAYEQGIQLSDVFVPFVTATTVFHNTPLKTVVQKKQGTSMFYAKSEKMITTGNDYGKQLITEVFYDFDGKRITYTKRQLKGDLRCNLTKRNLWVSR